MNNLISEKIIQEFCAYANNYEDSKEALEQKRLYLESALQIIEDYLGYPLALDSYDEIHEGIGSNDLYLHNIPIIDVNDILINGRDITEAYGIHWEDIDILGDHIHLSSYGKRAKFKECDEIRVSYTSGYRCLPPIVKQTLFRIASLLMTESNGNIGLTSKSYGDNTRSFLNYTNFSKYLSPLSTMRRFTL